MEPKISSHDKHLFGGTVILCGYLAGIWLLHTTLEYFAMKVPSTLTATYMIAASLLYIGHLAQWYMNLPVDQPAAVVRSTACQVGLAASWPLVFVITALLMLRQAFARSRKEPTSEHQVGTHWPIIFVIGAAFTMSWFTRKEEATRKQTGDY